MQIVFWDEQKIQISDGMNTAYLNMFRAEETSEKLCRAINKTATTADLFRSIFVITDFTFVFDWDTQNTKLVCGVESDSFTFLHPGSFHERIFRSKDIVAVMSINDQEVEKRTAMKKKICIPAEEIDMGELLNIASSGGIVVEDEEQLVRSIKQREFQKAVEAVVESNHGPVIAGEDKTLEKLGVSQIGNHVSTQINHCIVIGGWINFPDPKEDDLVLTQGKMFQSFEEFYSICMLWLILDCSEKPPANVPKSKFMTGTVRKSTESVPTLTNLGLLVEEIEDMSTNNLLAIDDLMEAQTGQTSTEKKKSIPKKRLKKSEVSAYKDPEESPIKLKKREPISVFEEKSSTPDLDLYMTNLTAQIDLEPPKPPSQKPAKPSKLNSKAKFGEPEMKQRSPSKVACRLRSPKLPRSYTLRRGASASVPQP